MRAWLRISALIGHGDIGRLQWWVLASSVSIARADATSLQRMQGLSLLLAHPAGQSLPFNPDTYLSSASSSPLALANAQAGVVDLDGLKMMMMYYETYRVIGDWRAASMGLERTAGEVSRRFESRASLLSSRLRKPAWSRRCVVDLKG